MLADVTVFSSRGRSYKNPITDNPYQVERFGTSNPNEDITVPQALWKVVLGFDPHSKSEFPDYYYALWMPNNSYEIQKELIYDQFAPDGTVNKPKDPKTWPWNNYLISIGSLESILNADLAAQQFSV